MKAKDGNALARVWYGPFVFSFKDSRAAEKNPNTGWQVGIFIL